MLSLRAGNVVRATGGWKPGEKAEGVLWKVEQEKVRRRRASASFESASLLVYLDQSVSRSNAAEIDAGDARFGRGRIYSLSVCLLLTGIRARGLYHLL